MKNSRALTFSFLIIPLLIATSLLSPVSASGGKGYKGHPITFNPKSVSSTIALDGFEQRRISFRSETSLEDVAVWIVPEIWSFVSIEPNSFEQIEGGKDYEVLITFSAPADASPGCYDGTIQLRDDRRMLAKPFPVDIEILDEYLPNPEWRYRRYDLAGTSCNPNGSALVSGEEFSFNFSIPDTDHYVLTGDVDGDWEAEIITTSGSTLNIYSGAGTLERSILLPRDCQLSMLEDADGDGVLDIGLGSRSHGFAGYFYRSDGTLLQSFMGQHGGSYGDHSMTLLTISDGKVLAGYNAGYSRTPRGVASFDYASGIEEWYYQVGPANGIYSLADMDNDGALDITMNSATVHNGASGNGTTDGDLYLIAVDEHGGKQLSQKYPSPSNGNARHLFADMNSDGDQEIIAFEGHDPRYYPGQSQVHVYDNTGALLHTFDGPKNSVWDYAVGDLDGDGTKEVVASARNAQRTFVLDSQLYLLGEVDVVGNVKLICDLTGDGFKEIVLLDDSGWLRVLDLSFTQIAEVKCGNKGGNVIASDINTDGIVEVLIQTDLLYVYSFAYPSIDYTSAGDAFKLVEVASCSSVMSLK